MPKNNYFPNKEQILKYINDNNNKVGKREIARAFSIKGDNRIILKKIIKELEDDGLIAKKRKKTLFSNNSLPEITTIVITAIKNEDIIATPDNWKSNEMPPKIIVDDKNINFLPAIGDKFLARLKKTSKTFYKAVIIKRIEKLSTTIVGIFKIEKGGGIVEPADKKIPQIFKLSPSDSAKLKHEDLVVIEPDEKNPFSSFAKLIGNFGHYLSIKALPMIAVINQGIPFEFSDAAKKDAQTVKTVDMNNRTDLTNIPFVTIDGETAKDFDDAIFAEPDSNKKNKNGWHLIIAIADISWYVRPQTALDNEAKNRGNSVYFAGGVIPMLPKELSNELCSLKPYQKRPCLAVHVWIDKDGNKISHQFERVMIKSCARLTYTEVQEAIDGKLNDNTAPILANIIKPLYQVYAPLAKARKLRETLEIDLTEKKVSIDENGNIATIEPEKRYDSNRLIEEFMILANICSAEELEKYEVPAMFRIHEAPSAEKREHLYDFLKTFGINIPTGKTFTANYYNNIIENVSGNPIENLVKQMILRCQSQAKYSPENIGHFGLALSHYAHFTSPIRRYADLLVHRALVTALNLGEGGLSKQDIAEFADSAEHISMTERKAMSIERETMDRFMAVYMMNKTEKVFAGTITGVTTAGLFITLEENGADGLVPMRSLPGGRYELDEKNNCLRGDKIFRLGDEIDIILKEANPLSGHLLFALNNVTLDNGFSKKFDKYKKKGKFKR